MRSADMLALFLKVAVLHVSDCCFLAMSSRYNDSADSFRSGYFAFLIAKARFSQREQLLLAMGRATEDLRTRLSGKTEVDKSLTNK